MLRTILIAICVVAGAVAAWLYFAAGPAPVDVAAPDEATPTGQVLEIDIAGQANGTVTIQLFGDTAPQHVAQIVALAEAGAYNDVVFHRVIDGFMAQTGDVQHGRVGGNIARAGTGGSDRPDLPAEFSDIPFTRGIVGMARSQNPNSANSQFFIMFADGDFLNGQYTVVGEVTAGMDVVDAIKRGEGPNGAVLGDPDRMAQVRVVE